MSYIARRTIIPVNQITPLTYRDGVTYIQMLSQLSEYIKSILHPSLQHTVDQLVADVETQMDKHHDQYVDGVQEFQRIHDAFMSDVNAKLIALNDGAVSDLVADGTSLLGGMLREIFTDREAFTTLSDNVDYQQTQNKVELQNFRDGIIAENTSFRDTVNESVDQQHQHTEQQFNSMGETLKRVQKMTGQTDYVSRLSAGSNVSMLQLEKTGNGDGGAFQISFLNQARGTFVQTSFNSGSVSSNNDDYHRIWETWSGNIGSRYSDGAHQLTRDYLMSPASNWEFAYRTKPVSRPNAEYEWIPRHGSTPSAFLRAVPVIRDGNRQIPIHSASVGSRWTTNTYFELTQRVYGRHTSTGDQNLLDIITKHRYTMDGRIIITGTITALSDVEFFSGYHIMFPGGTDVDEIYTSFGNAFPRKRDGTTQRLDEESNLATSYAMVSSKRPTHASAVKYVSAADTLLWDNDQRTGNQRSFIDHRDAPIVKIYNQLFDKGHVMKAGTVHRFHGEYAFVEASLARAMIAG